MSLVTEEIRAKAEMCRGDEICKEKSQELLRELGLPNGLLPLHDIEECGYVKETGFVWLKQKNSITHKFEKIRKLVSYATEVTAVVEPNKIKKLTGVKTKELLIWITLSDIYIADPSSGKITFQTPAGLNRSFPVSAFQVEEKEKDVKDEDNKEMNEAMPVKDVKDEDNKEMNEALPVKDVKDEDNKEMNEAVPVKVVEDEDNKEMNEALPVKELKDEDNKDMNEAVPVKDL